MQITRDELQDIIYHASLDAELPMPEYEAIISAVEGVEGVTFNAHEAKYVCPVRATFGNKPYRQRIEEDALIFRFQRAYDRRMSERFNVKLNLFGGYNVDVI